MSDFQKRLKIALTEEKVNRQYKSSFIKHGLVDEVLLEVAIDAAKKSNISPQRLDEILPLAAAGAGFAVGSILTLIAKLIHSLMSKKKVITLSKTEADEIKSGLEPLKDDEVGKDCEETKEAIKGLDSSIKALQAELEDLKKVAGGKATIDEEVKIDPKYAKEIEGAEILQKLGKGHADAAPDKVEDKEDIGDLLKGAPKTPQEKKEQELAKKQIGELEKKLDALKKQRQKLKGVVVNLCKKGTGGEGKTSGMPEKGAQVKISKKLAQRPAVKRAGNINIGDIWVHNGNNVWQNQTNNTQINANENPKEVEVLNDLSEESESKKSKLGTVRIYQTSKKGKASLQDFLNQQGVGEDLKKLIMKFAHLQLEPQGYKIKESQLPNVMMPAIGKIDELYRDAAQWAQGTNREKWPSQFSIPNGLVTTVYDEFGDKSYKAQYTTHSKDDNLGAHWTVISPKGRAFNTKNAKRYPLKKIKDSDRSKDGLARGLYQKSIKWAEAFANAIWLDDDDKRAAGGGSVRQWYLEDKNNPGMWKRLSIGSISKPLEDRLRAYDTSATSKKIINYLNGLKKKRDQEQQQDDAQQQDKPQSDAAGVDKSDSETQTVTPQLVTRSVVSSDGEKLFQPSNPMPKPLKGLNVDIDADDPPEEGAVLQKLLAKNKKLLNIDDTQIKMTLDQLKKWFGQRYPKVELNENLLFETVWKKLNEK